ncbi:NAD(P)/FAD-dependent oxidoreductase [Candidatus Woesearchaeota archaeon]|nr:NAD(P)/FAD-dependent oxidoreductase [Candidatus Woesearchaeota archaeon]
MVMIIGAGPAGSYTAYLLAKKGIDVQVFEEHNIIGEPFACTGIITGILSNHFKPPEEVILRKIDSSRIFSPSGDYVDVGLKNDVVLDRAKLDRHLAKIAQEAGAKYFLGKRFVDCAKDRDIWKVRIYDREKGGTETMMTDALVGADGPLSRVAKSAGIYGERKFYTGIQVTAEAENDGFIEFYPKGKDIAWFVPAEKGKARVGIAALERPDEVFRRFVRERLGQDYEKKVVARQAGLIPLYNPKIKTEKDGVYLVGDAATTAKATTLGGINQSLTGAMCLTEAILSGKSYEKLWKKRMGRELRIALLMRKAMNKFSDEDYEKLVNIFKKEKNRKLLENYERDAPSKFAFKLALREPRLLGFARFML